MKMPFINNSLGIDLLNDSRPFAYFSADSKLACLNDEYYLIIDKNWTESLYRYKNKDLTNYLESQRSLADSMKTYTYSMLQTTQYLIRNRLVGMQ